MKHIAKKWLAGILSVVMVFSLLPVMARAEEDGETPEKTAAERVQELIDALPDAETITGDNRADVEAQIDAIDAAMLELTGDEAAALDTARYEAAVAALSALDGQPADPDPEPSAAERVQELIDALPDAETITEDNRADVEAQIDAIDAVMAELSEDEAAVLDTARYDAAVAALLALDVPSALEQVQALIDALPEAETITDDNRADVEAQIDAIDGAMAELTEDEAAALDTARYEAAVAALSALDDQIADPDPEPSAAERVQELIDALPDAEEITADNRADVEAQLSAIDEAKLGLEDEELDGLDVTRYMAAAEAISALDGMSGGWEPMPINLRFSWVNLVSSEGETIELNPQDGSWWVTDLGTKTFQWEAENFHINFMPTMYGTYIFQSTTSADDEGDPPWGYNTGNVSFDGKDSVTVYLRLAGYGSERYNYWRYSVTVVNGKPTPSVVVQAESSLKYNGTDQKLIKSAPTKPSDYTGPVQYAVKPKDETPQSGDWKNDWNQITARNVGEYCIWVKTGDNGEYVARERNVATVRIDKGDPTVTPPTAVSVTYNGEPRGLFATAGSVSAGQGTMKYALGTSGSSGSNWKDSPNEITATNAGDYYIWYKVDGNDDYNGVGAKKLTAKIAQAASSVVVGDVGSITYGDPITLTATVTATGVTDTNNITGTVTFKAGDATLGEGKQEGNKWTLTIGANDTDKQHALFGNGSNTQVTAVYSGNDNIAEKTSGAKSVKVEPKELTFEFTANEKTYDGGTDVTGTLKRVTDLVSGDTDVQANYTATAANKNVGDAVDVTVTVKLSGDDAKYYKAKAPTGVKVKIVKAENNSVTAPVVATNLTYNGTDQELIQTAGSSENGTMKYFVGASAPELDAEDWKDAIADIKGKDAGTYKVWYYVDGDNNHNDTAAQSITVEIAKKEVGLTWSGYEGLTYTGKPQNVTADFAEGAIVGGDKDKVSIVVTNGDKVEANPDSTYTATAKLNGDRADNYTLSKSTKTKDYTIGKATVKFEIDGESTFTYDTEAQTVTVKENEADTTKLPGAGSYDVLYTANESGTSTDGTANKINVGAYGVWVKLSDEAYNNYMFEGGEQEAKVGTMTIKQAELKLEVSGSGITYGDTLSKSVLTGKATIGEGTVISGEWAWDATDGAKYPAVKTDSGKTEYTVKFTPTSSEAENFTTDSLSTEIKITVKPYELTPKVVASSVSDKIYDGTTSVMGGELEFENMELFNSAPFNGTKPTISGTFAFTSKDAGTKTVNVTGIEFKTNGENYSLSTNKIDNATVDGSIQKKMVTLTWKDFEDLGYDKTAKNVTATTTDFVADDVVSLSYKDNDKVNAGTYTATAELAGTDAGNYTISNPQQEYTITPAKVSFTIGAEDKVDWATRGETNEDPNPDGYKLNGEGTAYVLSMTYDSYKHKASVSQKTGEAVVIGAGDVNGFTVTYRKKDTVDDLTEIRDAGKYEIMVNLTPTEGNIYNYAFDGQDASVHSLKIGEITVEPYTVHVTWSHLKYVYHAHKMHPNVRVQNAFKADVQPNVVPDDFDPAVGYSGELLAFAETSGADVGNYDVEVTLYGTSAGNYVVDDNTETVTIVPAPVTFTVGDNVWVIDNGTVDRTSVTLRPTWGAVSTTPDVAVHHSYPLAGAKINEALETQIVYKKDGEEVTSPGEAGKYEVWVKIGNENYRHSATETGELHHVGELVITDDPNSIRTYTVTFDPGYEGAPKGPAAIEKAFPNQTVVLPPVSGKNGDETTYDLTRKGYSFLGWSYNGHTYQPNEELHMPAADVTFKGEWIEAVPIGGRVVQESSGGEPTPVNGATVVLKQGSEPTAEAVTGSDGSFDFGLVTPGIYNLEVTYENGGGAKIVKTFLVEVGDGGSVDNEFVLPDTALNTVVEVAPGIKSAVSMDGMITDEAAADVYTESDKKTVEDGGTVEFKMSISETTLTGPQEEEIPVPEERISMVLDMELTKTVTENGGTSGAPVQIHDSKIPVTTVIHLPAEIQGKSGYTVYRFHDEDGDGNAEMRAITTSKNANGEYLQVVREGTAIELHAEFYSTYVLTWYQSSGGGATAYPVTLPENALNGTVTANYEKAVKNSVVTLTVTPDEGHVLGELTVTDSDGNAIALTDNGDGTYSFVMPDGGVTVKAVFNCEGGENCQSRKFTDLDVKAWYHDYTDYVIGCGLMHGVGGNLFDPNGAVTRAQMVTVLWNMSGDPVVNYYMTYSDIGESAWYAEAIRWATSEGVVDGYGNGLFGPNDPITREQMATMLYRYEKKYGDGGFTGEWMYRLPFTDLDQISDWAFEAVAWCNMKGIITGKDGNRVDPKGSAKRCEMAAVLTRYRDENDTENDTE